MKQFRSLITNNTYPFEEYSNHGTGGIKYGKKDLPKEEYPYTVEFDEESNHFDYRKFRNEHPIEYYLAYVPRIKKEYEI